LNTISKITGIFIILLLLASYQTLLSFHQIKASYPENTSSTSSACRQQGPEKLDSNGITPLSCNKENVALFSKDKQLSQDSEADKPCGVPMLPAMDYVVFENLQRAASQTLIPPGTQPPNTWRFWVDSRPAIPPHQHDADLVRTTDHAYIYWERGIPVDNGKVVDVADAIDRSFDIETSNLGNVPESDGYLRIFIYLGNLHGSGGYFAWWDQWLNIPLVPPYCWSNDADIIYIDTFQSANWMKGTVAHELNHMIHWNSDNNEDLWVSEGLATWGAYFTFQVNARDQSDRYVSDLYCRDTANWFGFHPDVRLTWTEYSDNEAERRAQYGVSYVFMVYLYEKFGGLATIAGTQQQPGVLREPGNGIDGINNVLSRRGFTQRFVDVFNSWVIANFLDDTSIGSGYYGYDTIDITVSSSQHTPPVSNYEAVNYWAADYILLSGGGTGDLSVRFDGGDNNNFKLAVVKRGAAGTSVQEVSLDSMRRGSIIVNDYGTTHTNVILIPSSQSSSGFNTYLYSASASVGGNPSAHIVIEHSYRSDLIVTIGVGSPSSPSWSRVVWNREGGSEDDLDLSVDISDASQFLPPSLSNIWFLKVYDAAHWDQGRVTAFSIAYQGQTYSSTDVPVPIYDLQTSYAYIRGGAGASAHIFIQHTWRGDLVVTIGVGNPANPSWSKLVWNREGGSADNLDLTIDISEATQYLPPSSTSIWFLKVYDAAGWDQGSIATFTITYQGQTYSSPDVPVPIYDYQTSHAYIPQTPAALASAHIVIQHTYRGDLIVTVGVGDPNNPLWSMPVWNGEGGSADNLDITVDISGGVQYLPPSSSNRWFLKVYDRYYWDQGSITAFTITYQGQTHSSIDVPVPIYDLQTAYAYIPGGGFATAHIGIQHTWRGDLVVTVGVGDPNNPLWSVVAWNRQGGSEDNLDLTVDISGGAQYLPPSVDHRWFVKVYDAAAWDQGYLTTFTITYQGQTYSAYNLPVPIYDYRTSYAYIPSFYYLVGFGGDAHIFIEHTWIGDLVVTIGVGDPNNPLWSRVIWDRGGGSADNIDLTIDISEAAQYLPPSSTYRWFIKVYDAAYGDQGRLITFTIAYQLETYSSTNVPAPINDHQITYAYIPSGGMMMPQMIPATTPLNQNASIADELLKKAETFASSSPENAIQAYLEASNYYKMAGEIRKANDCIITVGDLIAKNGDASLESGNVEEAIALYRRAIEYYEMTGEADKVNAIEEKTYALSIKSQNLQSSVPPPKRQGFFFHTNNEFWFTWYDLQGAQIDNIHFTNPQSVTVTVTVSISDVQVDSFELGPEQSTYRNYPGVIGGPVHIVSSQAIWVTQRIVGWNSFKEISALASDMASKEIYYTWYDMKYASWDAIHFLNPSTIEIATIQIYMAGQYMQTFTLGPRQATYVTFPGVIGGPVKIVSDVPIFSTQRIVGWRDFDEVVGTPSWFAFKEHWFTWYDSVNAQIDHIHFINLGSSTATVTVYIAGVRVDEFQLDPGASTYKGYSGICNGPVHVSSDQPIRVTQRIVGWNGFKELFSVPYELMSSRWYFNWYDMKYARWDAIHITNPTAVQTTVVIAIGSEIKTFALAPGESEYVTLPGFISGPVLVYTEGGQPIMVTQRILGWGSFEETVGIQWT